MTREQIDRELSKGMDSIKSGRAFSADEVYNHVANGDSFVKQYVHILVD